MKPNRWSQQQQFLRQRTGLANCFGHWDSSGLRIDMRNIIDHSDLTSATTERRRARKTVTLPLVALGRRVVSPVKNLLKRRGFSERCPSSGSARRNTPQGAVQQNGIKLKLDAISTRRLEQAWLSQHHAEYAGDWVALEGASLVAHGSSARQVLDAARLGGYEQPLVVHLPSEPPLPFGGW